MSRVSLTSMRALEYINGDPASGESEAESNHHHDAESGHGNQHSHESSCGTGVSIAVRMSTGMHDSTQSSATTEPVSGRKFESFDVVTEQQVRSDQV